MGGLNTRLEMTENRISELEDKLIFFFTQFEQQKEKRLKENEQSLWTWGTIEKYWRQKNVEQKKIFKKIMAENPLKLTKDIKQIHESEQTSKRINPKKSMPRIQHS